MSILKTSQSLRRSRMQRDWALLVMLATLWGASYTLIEIGVATMPPVTLIAARTLLAGSLLLGVIWMRGV